MRRSTPALPFLGSAPLLNLIRGLSRVQQGRRRRITRETVGVPVLNHRVPLRNLTVVAFNKADGFYYPGYQETSSDARLTTVKFFTLRPERLPHDQVIPFGGAHPSPPLQVLDNVLAKVKNASTKVEYFVPGTVLMTPKEHQFLTKRFLVQLYNGKNVSLSRRDVIKIAAERYRTILVYLALLHKSTIEERSLVVKKPPPSSVETQTETVQTRNKGTRAGSLSVEKTDTDVQTDPMPTPGRLPGTAVDVQTDVIQSTHVGVQINIIPDTQTDAVQTDLNFQVDLEESPLQQVSDEEEDLTGSEVLARWSDDGWFYVGCVVRKIDTDLYVVRDVTGHSEEISRRDIIRCKDQAHEQILPRDHVIALHPHFLSSFAPGIVRKIAGLSKCEVRFYDRLDAVVSCSDIYPVPNATYDACVEYIFRREDEMEGKTMLARNDLTGYYKPCVVERVEDHHFYRIRWEAEETVTKQKVVHCFELSERLPEHQNWRFVLAPVDGTALSFLPGRIVGSVQDTVTVLFCNGKRTPHVSLNQCFWLSKDYYQNAANFYSHVTDNKPQADDVDRMKAMATRTVNGVRFQPPPPLTSG